LKLPWLAAGEPGSGRRTTTNGRALKRPSVFARPPRQVSRA
jgi:hypothetical protein